MLKSTEKIPKEKRMSLITRHQFDNGLTLLLVETHQAPVVSINICVRVGSRYESDQEAGICHLIEHMLFKGTERLAAGEVAKKIEASGGEVNAYTSFDETVYYCTLSSRHFEVGLETLSDAVLHSVFDAEELSREKEVVVEEILRSKDSPGKVLSEAVFQKAFPLHTYGRPIIGFPETVRGFTREKIIQFWKDWYVPENMVVVIAGDFKAEHAMKKCQNIFGDLKAIPSPKVKVTTESPQSKTQAIALANPIEASTMMLAYHVPELKHEDIPALDVLSHILGEGESSRLEINIKEKLSLVNSIYSYVYSPQDPGLMVIGYTPLEKNTEKATHAILHEISRLHHQEVEHDELIRAKINIKSDAIYEKETVEGLARKYGYFETILKKHDFDEHYYQLIDAVSRSDVQRVAQKYLQPQNLTLGLIHPQSDKKKWNAKDLLALSSTKKAPKVRAVSQEEPQYFKLKNGIKLILKENHTIPTLVIRTASQGGLRFETTQSNGIYSLLSHVWGKSTQHFNSEELARQIELIAGSISAYNGRNAVGMKADFLSEKTHDGLQLFLDAYLNPRFDPEEIKKEKNSLLESIRREEDHLASLAFKNFLKTLYPKHPYGLPMHGNGKTVRSFSRNDLIKAYQRSINPQETVISVVGDFDSDYMMAKLRPALESIKASRTTSLKTPQMLWPKNIERIEKTKDKMQAHLVLGFPGCSFYDRDRYALDVLNNILAGQGGRLFLELRDKLSLAYSVSSMTQEGIEPGYFGVYIATEPRKVPTAIEGIIRELEKVVQAAVSKEELDRAKQYMVGAYEIDLQRNSTVATQLVFNELYGLPRNEWKELPKKVMKVTAQDVLKVARRIIKLDRYVLSVVRP